MLLLRPVPTTNGGDGYVHFGDMLTLRSVGVSKSQVLYVDTFRR